MTQIDEVIIPPRDGRTFDVPAGRLFRIVSIDGRKSATSTGAKTI